MKVFSTPAHEASAFAVIDPVYSIETINPPSQTVAGTQYWHYAPGELEAFHLEQMRKLVKTAKLKVGYPGFFRTPARTIQFSRWFRQNEEFDFHACGNVEIKIGEDVIARFENSSDLHHYKVPEDALIILVISTGENDVPTFGTELDWDFSYGFGGDPDCDIYPRNAAGIPPHKLDIPLVEVNAGICKENPACYDLERETMAYIELEAAEKPVLYVGESIPETFCENPEDMEQSTELDEIAPGKYRSRTLLAMRYFRFAGTQPDSFRILAVYHPVQYAGAYASDPRSTRIWMNGAYTLHLCMHRFLIDGIKRDRLPWGGDLAVSLLSNAYSMRDADIVRATLRVLTLTLPHHGDVNGITDYTLWTLVNHDIYQKYFNDPEFLRSQYKVIYAITESLLTRRNKTGFLTRNVNWLFIDWVPEKSPSALQMLFYWALKSSAALAKRMKRYDDAARWDAAAEQLAFQIREKLWDPRKGLFRISSDCPEKAEFSKHANILAICSGLADIEEAIAIVAHLKKNDLPPVGTPYMSAFEAMACGAAGQTECFNQVLESIWGSMLDLGATSFWEAFDPAESGMEHYVFYDRPFGRSFCHAWGAGPTFLYPMIQLGIRPLSDGWRRFTVKPIPGVTDALCTVPTPHGQICVTLKNGELSVQAPDGCELVE